MPKSRTNTERVDQLERDVERRGAEDYHQFLGILRGELERAVAPLADNIKNLAGELRELRAQTYTREMTDNKFQALTDRIKEHDDDLKGIHNIIGNSGREVLERIGALVAIGYGLIYIIPHLFH